MVSHYLLTPCSRVILEKLNGLQLVKKFPAFYGTRRFITSFTSTSHLSLSSARSIQHIPPHPTSWRSILILSSHLRLGLPSGLFPQGFPTKISFLKVSPPNPVHASPLPHTRYMPRPSYSRFYHPHNIGWGVQNISSSLCSFLHSPVTSSLLGPNILLNTLFSNTLNLRSSVHCPLSAINFHIRTKQRTKL